MNPVLLHLYPAGFRRAFGDEIADSYREATAGAGPRARLREAADVAAHALRLRLGIGSVHAGGRLLAAAAPFGLAATAGYAAFNLVGSVSDWYVIRSAGVAADAGTLATLMNAGYLLTLIGAVVALAGRHVPGVLCAIVGTVVSSVSFLYPIWRMPPDLTSALVGFLLMPVLIAALPLACPPDLRPSRRVRGAAGVFALVAWAALLVVALSVIDPLGIGLLTPWRFGVPMIAALALVGRRAFAEIRTTAQLAFAGAPFIATMHFSGWVRTEEVVTVVGALAVTAVALRIRRRSDSDRINPA
ncbi:hypothetical protein GCM10010331_18660 [Streptomyces xanthochromogenes]|uniref:hypothetical protein n=1 Tax=Streptomyces xanthochromogenes TaxID=67384 RepID=UPI001675367D|nr:hypothetical protein [Streptomyces xanthochromogenes]GHB32161.1 hypothetical protein GCM10010331_18660 [Streptomyces xanthochromogenes]